MVLPLITASPNPNILRHQDRGRTNFGLTAFSEVRFKGILRTSAACSRTPEREEGDVVLLLPAIPYEGVQFLQEEGT